ncbi:MAG TPA: glycoside hydrolase family 2 TIM barrel-domain containing protein, partial [Flavisolibacter sp.]
VDPDVNYYQGPSWYRTQLDIKNQYKNGRTILHFEGAGQKTDVYVYTTKVGSHVGGYDEFSVDITDAVEAFKKTDVFQKQFAGKVPISIRTDNSRDLEMMPSDLSDFNIYGGIYRHLNLIYAPAVSLEKVFAYAETDAAGKTGKLRLKTRFHNPLNVTDALVSVRLLDQEGRLVQQAEKKLSRLSGDITITDLIVKSPKLWSTDNPYLYSVETTVTANGSSYTQKDKVGFRHFEFVKKGPFLLNGKRLLLRGTHRHEDHAGVAAAMTDEMMRDEMVMMKEMGVNFIRLGHYQQSRTILDLCDSLGIVVWEEIPWCRGGLGGEVYREQGRRMLTNMIEQHYNHPSVIIWGLGNENDWPGDFTTFNQDRIRAYMKELNDLSHKLDPSRKTAIRRCDFCKDIVDVYSPSIWAGWYRGIYTEYKDVSKSEFDKVDYFLHVEWGGDSHAGRHSETPDKALQQIGKAGAADERAGDASLFGGAARVSKDGDWSESYICNLMDWHLKEQ